MRKPNKLTVGILSIALVLILMVVAQFNGTVDNELEKDALIVQQDLLEEIAIEEEDGIKDIEELEKEEFMEVAKEEKIQATKVETPSTSVGQEKKETAAVGHTYKEASANTSPITGDSYTVKSGDSLYLIAQRANTSFSHLKVLNGLSGDTIYVGQVLKTKGTVAPTVVAEAPVTQPVTRGASRDEEVYWLSRIIHAEAQGEPYQGKVAVGNVVLNRVKDSNFPNSIYGVVFDRQHGYTQFSPVIDGSIYNTPHADSVKAAREALDGVRPVGEALYFLNPRKATNFWIPAQRKYMMTIGDHDFYY
ncbi:MAG: cell wall hydrolase [Clostridiaceae bacterium]|nr:cell wall hydrolase [Clostridiaceae bacterium]